MVDRRLACLVVALRAPGGDPVGARTPHVRDRGAASACPPAPRSCTPADRFAIRRSSSGDHGSSSAPIARFTEGDRPRVANRVVGGILGAMVGFGVGLWIGQEAASDRPLNEQEWAGVDEGLVGSALGALLAASLLDGRRGRLWASLAVAAGLDIAGHAVEPGWLPGTAPIYGVALGAVLH